MLITPDRDKFPDQPIIGSSAYCENDVLDYSTTKTGSVFHHPRVCSREPPLTDWFGAVPKDILHHVDQQTDRVGSIVSYKNVLHLFGLGRQQCDIFSHETMEQREKEVTLKHHPQTTAASKGMNEDFLVTSSTVCKTFPGLSKEQLELCHRYPDVTMTAVEGLQMAVDECQYQFQWHRWNCSSLSTKNKNPHSSVLLQKGELRSC
uniref:Protein Wnt n=1 Tax=Timema monikensis TaxID=170555 RepID=A0A7R9DXI4_9NEOP|nr:unnamed protein product [Timema monikensis]